MREAADAEKIERLARELGRVVPRGTRMYLTGGATAVPELYRFPAVDPASLRNAVQSLEDLDAA